MVASPLFTTGASFAAGAGADAGGDALAAAGAAAPFVAIPAAIAAYAAIPGFRNYVNGQVQQSPIGQFVGTAWNQAQSNPWSLVSPSGLANDLGAAANSPFISSLTGGSGGFLSSLLGGNSQTPQQQAKQQAQKIQSTPWNQGGTQISNQNKPQMNVPFSFAPNPQLPPGGQIQNYPLMQYPYPVQGKVSAEGVPY